MATKIKLDKIENKKFTVDAIDVTVEDADAPIVEKILEKVKEGAKVVDSLVSENDEMKKNIDKANAEKDQAVSEVETLKKSIEDSKANFKKSVDAAVAEKMEIELVAAYAGLDSEARKCDNKELKLKVIKTKISDFKEEGKSDDYINARFDAIADAIKQENKNNLSIAKLIENAGKKNDAEPEKSYRDEYIEKMKKLNNK